MKASMRAKRMARHQRRLHKQSRLNLVSLMDIFTILVFFLMVNNGDVEVITADKDIALPESMSEQKPAANLLVKITAEDVRFQGEQIATIESILASDSQTIQELATVLREQAKHHQQPEQAEKDQALAITIMGDKDIPYQLLKKVISTCAATDFRDVSLAVNSVPVDSDLLLNQEQQES